MTVYRTTDKVLTAAQMPAYFVTPSYSGEDHTDVYTAMLDRGLLISGNELGIDILQPDGVTLVDDNQHGDLVCGGNEWINHGYRRFPVAKLVADGYLVSTVGDAKPKVTQKLGTFREPAIKVNNRKNDGPCPVCGTRTVEFACFSSISYICPQCRG